MKTHYDPHPHGEEAEEQAVCGTWLGDESNLSGDWSRVDCQRCLNGKGKIELPSLMRRPSLSSRWVIWPPTCGRSTDGHQQDARNARSLRAHQLPRPSPPASEGQQLHRPYGPGRLGVVPEGWQASREAVVVELPSPYESAPPYACYEGGWNDMRVEAVDGIEEQGLKVKAREVKP